MAIDDNCRAQLVELVSQAREVLAYEASLGTPGVSPVTLERGLPSTVQVAHGPPPDLRQPDSASRMAAEPVRSTAPDTLDTPARQADGQVASAPLVTAAVVARPGRLAAFDSGGVEQQAASQETDDGRRVRLAALATEAQNCTACRLHERRQQAVFARGNANAPLMFIGEGPGRDEDRLGEPFVGAAGRLLDRMIGAMGFSQDEVYICNVVKCRPPENRTPRPDEAGTCMKFLRAQVALVAPRAIVALGRCAAENLAVAPAQGTWRGRWGQFDGVDVMPTYHPAFLLRSPEFKRVVWQDLQVVMGRLGRSVPR